MRTGSGSPQLLAACPVSAPFLAPGQIAAYVRAPVSPRMHQRSPPFDSVTAALERLLDVGPDVDPAIRSELRVVFLRAARGEHGPAPARELLAALGERVPGRRAVGAYFTGADIAAYGVRSTLLPWLHHRAGLSPRPEGDAARWLPEAVRSPELLPGEMPREREGRRARVERARAAAVAGDLDAPEAWTTHGLELHRRLREQVPELDAGAARRLWEALAAARVLDPTCGAGAFLLAAFAELLPLATACRARLAAVDGEALPSPAALAAAALHGLDLRPEAVLACRLSLALASLEAGLAAEEVPAVFESLAIGIRAGDVLDAGAFAPETRFDLMVGNPPYRSRGRDQGPEGYATARCPNLYAPVAERGLRLLAPGGRAALVLPVSAVSLAEYQPLRDLLFREAAWVSTYSNRPARLFAGVEQRHAVVLTGPGSGVHTTAYQHWYAEERPHLVARLEYVPAAFWQGCPVKSGSPLAERVFARLARARGRLAALAVGGEHRVWLHDAPTYWVRALTHDPNPGRSPGHWHVLGTPTAAAARALAAVLSSTAFYFFFKQVSNCRDLGRREWAEFPLDPLPPARLERLAARGEELESAMRAAAATRTRRYPSGTAVYTEHSPAAALAVLERIDRELAAQYGLDEEETEFLLQYDLKYRLGRRGGAGGDEDG